MSEHTKEPWRIAHDEGDEYYIEVTSRLSGHTCQLGSGYFSKDDARRIVACVNACAGIPDSALEEAAKCANSGRFGTMAALYKAQRDELHKEILGMKCYINNPSAWDHFSQNVSDSILRLVALVDREAAIANAEKPPCA